MEGVSGSRWGATVRSLVVFNLVGLSVSAAPLTASKSLIEATSNAEAPELSQMRWKVGSISVPALWGMRVIGADLAKDDLRDLPRQPVSVYVSDAGVKVGATRVFEVPGEPRQKRKLKLKITQSVNPGIVGDIVGAIDQTIPDEIPDPFDPTQPMETYHATHVAGVIGAQNGDFGVSPFAQIVDMNIFKGMNLYKEENFVAALEKLAVSPEPIDVINMSHGISAEDSVRNPMNQIIEKKNAILVAAAGNEGAIMVAKHPLARKDGLFVVGALGYSGAAAWFSNVGPSIDVVAPGEEILSRGGDFSHRGESLEFMTGTSMAAPFVSGTFANLKALLPKAKAEDLKKIVRRTAVDLGLKGFDWHYGWGLVNEVRSVAVASRLVRNSLTAKTAVSLALTVDATLSFKELERKSRIESARMGFNSPEYEKGLRRAVLLSGDPARFEELFEYSLTVGDLGSAAMWGYLAANLQGTKITEKNYKLISALTWMSQINRAKTQNDALSLIAGIMNADFALQMFDATPAPILDAVEPIFRAQIAELAPDRLKDLDVLVAKKHPAPSESDPMLAINTAN